MGTEKFRNSPIYETHEELEPSESMGGSDSKREDSFVWRIGNEEVAQDSKKPKKIKQHIAKKVKN